MTLHQRTRIIAGRALRTSETAERILETMTALHRITCAERIVEEQTDRYNRAAYVLWNRYNDRIGQTELLATLDS